jgi:hypothetical protein
VVRRYANSLDSASCRRKTEYGQLDCDLENDRRCLDLPPTDRVDSEVRSNPTDRRVEIVWIENRLRSEVCVEQLTTTVSSVRSTSVLDTGQPRWGDNGGKPLEGTRLCCRPEMYNLCTIMAEDSLR